MKRAISCMAAVVIGAAACSPAAPEPEAAGERTNRWTRPPVIERVEPAGGVLTVSGVADPGARVVLRSDGGAAFAASADSRGRFEIRVPAPAGHLLLRPETQVGQDASPSPDHLLIVAGGRGPIAVLRPGGATRRLDAAPVLGAVDSDGRMRLVSGRAAPRATRVEVRSDGDAVQIVPDPRGRWSVMLAAHPGPDAIQVDGREFLWPGAVQPAQPLTVTPSGAGWSIGWVGPGGARQSTWLPDRAAP